MPAKKPKGEGMLPITVTIAPEHRKWLEKHREYGFRNASHAVDTAIGMLKKSKETEQKAQGQ